MVQWMRLDKNPKSSNASKVSGGTGTTTPAPFPEDSFKNTE